MIATIASKEYRPAGNEIKFHIDERSIKAPNNQRKLVQGNYLDGTYFLVSWDYKQAGSTYEIQNLIMSRDDYDSLLAMKYDNIFTEYLFHYIDQSWPVVITDIQKTGIVGKKINVAIQLLVTSEPV